MKQLQPVEPKKSLFKRIIGFFLGTSDNKAEQSEKSAKTNKSSQKRIVTAEPTNGAVHAALAVTVRNAATAAVLLAENDSNARIVWNDRKLQRRLRRRNVRNVRAASARSVQNVQNGLNVPERVERTDRQGARPPPQPQVGSAAVDGCHAGKTHPDAACRRPGTCRCRSSSESGCGCCGD